MAWQLTIRLFGNAPDGQRHPVCHKHIMDDLADVPLLMELAGRQGSIIYAFVEPRPGWLNLFDRAPSRPRRSRRRAALRPIPGKAEPGAADQRTKA